MGEQYRQRVHVEQVVVGPCWLTPHYDFLCVGGVEEGCGGADFVVGNRHNGEVGEWLVAGDDGGSASGVAVVATLEVVGQCWCRVDAEALVTVWARLVQ